MIGSLSLAWSYSMWFNAVESEVYAMSQFFTHIVVWLILVWYEKADEPGNERWLLLIAYMIGLSTGVHLLMVLVLPAIALLMYFRRRTFQLKTFVGMMAATGLAFIMIYPGVVKWLPLSASKLFLWAPAVIIIGVVAYFRLGGEEPARDHRRRDGRIVSDRRRLFVVCDDLHPLEPESRHRRERSGYSGALLFVSEP